MLDISLDYGLLKKRSRHDWLHYYDTQIYPILPMINRRTHISAHTDCRYLHTSPSAKSHGAGHGRRAYPRSRHRCNRIRVAVPHHCCQLHSNHNMLKAILHVYYNKSLRSRTMWRSGNDMRRISPSMQSTFEYENLLSTDLPRAFFMMDSVDAYT